MSGGLFDVRSVQTSTPPHEELKARRQASSTTYNVPISMWTSRRSCKILRRLSLRNDDNITRFLSVMYHDTGVNEILPALVLEFIGKLDILLDAASGLQALNGHEARIIHGDLKTSNLLIWKQTHRLWNCFIIREDHSRIDRAS
jgi:serine/threonine protein kinase